MISRHRYSDLSAKSASSGIIYDVAVIGATGSGKSTTLNSFFEKEVASVGDGVDPETMLLDSYMLNDCFRLWDTPGFGDSIENDKVYSGMLCDLLREEYVFEGGNYGFIDLVVVVLEGGIRDIGTVYNLICDVVVPNIDSDRVVLAINQADFAMKGRNWNQSLKKPNAALFNFLDKKALSIQSRIFESTGVLLDKPVFYSAMHGYNVKSLVDCIVDKIPDYRRIIL